MQNKTFEEIRQEIGKLREQKGKEKETLKLINEALNFGHDFVANSFFEEALTHQHLYMNDSSSKKAITDMEKVILKAKFYINKYNLVKLNSKLFTFLGKVADYKQEYKKAIRFYRKTDMNLEASGHLSRSMIMAGQFDKGYKLARSVYNKFLSSSEGKELKKKSYQTWIIWLSGLVIRTINALYDKKVNFDKKEINRWISLIEKELNSKKAEFSYRKQELNDLKARLTGN